ncbi:MAG: hypothetical protein K2I77_02725 [Anaeroplasmataceae bacterium]|nr:hypothetical protein [Anaeroplasmataceae bacterium]
MGIRDIIYSEVKNHLLSYGATSRISSSKETFKKKGTMAVIRVVGKALNVYLAILPEPFLEDDYHVKDVHDVKQYQETPTMIKVKTKRSLKEFKEIVDVMMIHRDIKQKAHYKPVDYQLELVPNGEAILNGLGFSSDYLVPSVSAKIIPSDMPSDLERFLPTKEGEPINSDETYTPVYLDTLCNYYNDDDVVTKESLIESSIIKSPTLIVIKSRGTLDKRLTIFADLFESDALKMIYITNGKAVKITHKVE